MKLGTFCAILIVVDVGLSLPLGGGPRNKLRYVDWWNAEQKGLKQNIQVGMKVGTAKNVILFIGDGMGPSTVTAARILQAQQREQSLHNSKLAWEDFPFTSLSKTYNVDQLTPDSAGTATAILAGIKTNHGMVGLSQEAILTNCSSAQGHEIKNILKYSHEEGKWTGIVTTARITHATPAAAYASCPDRGWEADSNVPPSETAAGCKDIARQLVEDNEYIKVIFGGGRHNLIPINETDPEYPTLHGRRADGRNLMEEWKDGHIANVGKDEVKLVTDNKGFNAIEANSVEYVMGLFEPDHMQYELERNNGSDGEPSLTQLVEKAIRVLERSEKGYFLLVEGADIDYAHHENHAHKALTETIAMSNAVQKAVELTSQEDTLITVTADHSHVLILGGDPAPASDILGIAETVITGKKDDLEIQLDGDNLPHLTLTYANGPGYLYHRTNGSITDRTHRRRNVTEEALSKETHDPNYLQDSGIYRKLATHAGEDVAVYAVGPMSHLFHGTHEQTYIGHVMMYASCVGPNKDHCSSFTVLQANKALMFLLMFIAILQRLI